MSKQSERITRYNREVLSELRELSTAHADALNQRGGSLGWWDLISYYRTCCCTPKEVAEKLAAEKLFTKPIPN